MSDPIKHECGIALLRLKKPLQFYLDKYGTALYGLNKMYLLMEKQHNRGQDGAGLANIKFDVAPGTRYISRYRSVKSQPIKDIFSYINKRFEILHKNEPEKLIDVDYLKSHEAFTGELFLGHLRYGTFGGNKVENCHPFLRQNNWMTRNLVVAGNFNLTNVEELFDILVNIGQHPKAVSDAVTIIEKIGHFLDQENTKLFREYINKEIDNIEISNLIAENLNIQKILKNASSDWDGGYTMAGLFGHGDAFVIRDPNGIRPAFWYEDDEVFVVTSERPVIQTAFNVKWEAINELKPGNALIIKKNNVNKEVEINSPKEIKKCSFERIYFSRGTDKDIYKERLKLGSLVVDQILNSIDNDLVNAVFSFIPNTAEMSYYGMIKELENRLSTMKNQQIKSLDPNSELYDEKLQKILSFRTRAEKIMVKDAKLRTFITQDDSRDEMVAHVYDITYGSLRRNKDTVVIIDDSIVRGTTLKQSVIRILDRLEPKKIVIVSSAPQIRYPDCYGIDMAKIGDFIAFQAAIALLKDKGMEKVIDEVYQKCKKSEIDNTLKAQNHVQLIYKPFSDQEISDKISVLLKHENINAEVKIIFQTVDNLHIACPNHTGDWYFTGNYPTPGGNKVVNRSFINYIEGINKRAY
ncbi:MAG: amidophosphoribosyltransferase [Parvicellaceae bacterium]|tara:strand:+ start:1449 stop:3356 length:1908 start_codon:yes stop_codon:yes gene_type:complete